MLANEECRVKKDMSRSEKNVAFNEDIRNISSFLEFDLLRFFELQLLLQ